MRRILRFFTQRWLISLIGLSALMILIFLAGHHIQIAGFTPLADEFKKLIACMILLFLWGINNLRTRNKSVKANANLINQLSAAPEPEMQLPSVSDEEVATLKHRFDDALSTLEKTGIKGKFGRLNLYQLPWYVIIGPPGSGKTTLIENSGLDFPLSANESGNRQIAGVGGTRNCDWWFTNEAVLLDTAGRYTTQDSHMEVDSAGWAGFLNLLKETRPRRPLNGIIVAVSLGELQVDYEQQREYHATTIRSRILEIYRQLGVRLPVYLVLTKCDLVAGFNEFFDDLQTEHRHQVWGITFPDYAADKQADISPLFESEFDLLVQRAGDRVVKRLQEERDHHRRDLIFCFPQQLTNLKTLLSEFTRATVKSNRYEETPWVRGVYFTSGTQEGSPIDRVMATLANSFHIRAMNLPGFAGKARSFFIHRLLRDVVFRESELAGTNRRYENTRTWIQRASWIGVGAVSAGLIATWGVSFLSNNNYTSGLIESVDAYEAARGELDTQPSVQSLLDTLDRADEIREIGSDPPYLWGIGVYQGIKTEDASEQAYRKALNEDLLPFIKHSLEADIRDFSQTQNSNADTARIYTLLSTYLMLGKSEQFDSEQFESWVEEDWSNLPVEQTVVDDLNMHFVSLMEEDLPIQELDDATVERAREMICQTPVEYQVYARLKQQARAVSPKPFDLTNFPPKIRPLLVDDSSRQAKISVPGFYLRPAAELVLSDTVVEASISKVKSEVSSTCGTDPNTTSASSTEETRRLVQNRYSAEYIQQWETFLSELRLNPFPDISTSETAVAILSAADRPLHDLIRNITAHTGFAKLPGRDFLGKKTVETVGNLISSSGITEGPNEIEQNFASINQLLKKENETGLIADMDALLSELNAYVSAISKSSNVSESAYQSARQRMTNEQADAIRKTISLAKELPNPLNNILDVAAKESWGSVLDEAKRHIDSVWDSTAYRSCVDHIADRYPVNRTTDRDIALRDFGEFFGKGGEIDTFTRNYLEPFVDRGRWQSKTLDDKSLQFNPAFVDQMKKARTIQKIYFASEDKRPTASFHLTPLLLSPKTNKSILSIHDQEVKYDNGPNLEQQVKWPGPNETGEVRLQFENDNFESSRMIEKRGPWAWFRLLDSAKPSRQNQTEANVEFNIDGLWVRYRLRADSDNNPFTGSQDPISQFRCSENT